MGVGESGGAEVAVVMHYPPSHFVQNVRNLLLLHPSSWIRKMPVTLCAMNDFVRETSPPSVMSAEKSEECMKRIIDQDRQRR